MLMDFDPGVVAVSSRPFWLRWTDGAGRARRHPPDFFARRADGTAVVTDVRPDGRVPVKDAEVFAVTARACGAGGSAGGPGTSIRCWSRTCGGSLVTAPGGAWSRKSPRCLFRDVVQVPCARLGPGC